MKYKIGEKVIFRKDLVLEKGYDGITFLEEMSVPSDIYTIEGVEIYSYCVHYKIKTPRLPYTWWVSEIMIRPYYNLENFKKFLGGLCDTK